MKRMQGVINAAIVALLVKPVMRWLVARTRRRASERAHTTIVIPAQALLHTALPAQLTGMPSMGDPIFGQITDELGGREVRRAVVIAGSVALATAGIALAVAVLKRRRRHVDPSMADTPVEELVAIPVARPTGGSDEAVVPGAPMEDPVRSI